MRLVLGLILLLTACGPKANYKVPADDAYLYDGIYWNRAYTIVHQQFYTVDPSTGMLIEISNIPNLIALRDKAYKLMLESPEGAPHAFIWLTYCKLNWELEKKAKKPKDEIVQGIGSRRAIQ